MLTLYTVCTVVGGAFVILAAVAGIDGPDFDLDFETDLEFGARANRKADSLLSPQKRARKPFWWILTRFKFWTFGSCFFGLTGLLLSQFRPVLPANTILALSLLFGAVFGTAIAVILQHLQDNPADSMIRPDDLVGLLGTVEIPFDRESKGKVRVSIKGTNLDLVALTESSKSLNRGEQICIVGTENNKVWVVEREALKEYS
ncbi:MAG: NfeD-like protein [Cyanobacteriota bacterium]|nr:NfeD-like protein [Cyanobacteriota bacterium]